MKADLIARIAARYPSGSMWDRFHLKQRLRACPYEQLLPYFPDSGNVLDIGCGFGLLGWFLAETRPGLEYFGVDVDARKIELAKLAFERHPSGSKAAHLHAGDIASWENRPPHFAVIAVLDVLYLLPIPLQRRVVDEACLLLDKQPDAVLLLKILPPFRGPSRFRTWIQESLMVRVLRKTRSSGALFTSQDPRLYADWARARGLDCREIVLPTSPASILLVLRPGDEQTASSNRSKAERRAQ